MPTNIRGVMGTLFFLHVYFSFAEYSAKNLRRGGQVASGDMTTRQGVGVVSVLVLGAIACTCGPIVWVPALRYT